MKQQNEKVQQINEVEPDASSVWGGSGVNEARTGAKSDAPLTRLGSLPVLINALTRARPGHPRAHLVSTLIEQCKRFDGNRDAMRPKILRTIDQLVNAEDRAP